MNLAATPVSAQTSTDKPTGSPFRNVDNLVKYPIPRRWKAQSYTMLAILE